MFCEVVIVGVGGFFKNVQDVFGNNSSKMPQKVLFLGLPGAGKTVLFCSAMDLLQRTFNEECGDDSLVYEQQSTDRFINETIRVYLKNQKWPPNTQGREVHEVSININKKKNMLIYKDYGGEAFLNVFKESKENKKSTEEGVDIQKEVGAELLEDIEDSSDLIIVLDAAELFDNTNKNLSDCLFNILKTIDTAQFKGKIALVFAKGDVIENREKLSVRKAFMDQQPNSYSRIRGRGNIEIFLVSAVKTVINNDGKRVPPMGYTTMKDSENVVAPFYWLFGLEKRSLLNEKKKDEDGQIETLSDLKTVEKDAPSKQTTGKNE